MSLKPGGRVAPQDSNSRAPGASAVISRGCARPALNLTPSDASTPSLRPGCPGTAADKVAQASAPRDAAATNPITTAGAARPHGQRAGPNPPASPCQHRSAAGPSPWLQGCCKHVPRMFLACSWLFSLLPVCPSGLGHGTPARRTHALRPCLLPPGLAPARSHRAQYRDAGGGVKVTKNRRRARAGHAASHVAARAAQIWFRLRLQICLLRA